MNDNLARSNSARASWLRDWAFRMPALRFDTSGRCVANGFSAHVNRSYSNKFPEGRVLCIGNATMEGGAPGEQACLALIYRI